MVAWRERRAGRGRLGGDVEAWVEVFAVEGEAELLELVAVEGLAEGFGLAFKGAHHLLGCVGGCGGGGGGG